MKVETVIAAAVAGFLARVICIAPLLGDAAMLAEGGHDAAAWHHSLKP